jgi:hypothetical protein
MAGQPNAHTEKAFATKVRSSMVVVGAAPRLELERRQHFRS